MREIIITKRQYDALKRESNKFQNRITKLEEEVADLNNALEEARRGISEMELDVEKDGSLVKKKWTFRKDTKHSWVEASWKSKDGVCVGREIFCCEQILELILAFEKEIKRLYDGIKKIQSDILPKGWDTPPNNEWDKKKKRFVGRMLIVYKSLANLLKGEKK